ncbi:MAG: hypothetical protein H7067_07590 [Burkholderiales bacterium]|nr:hypothetical protein [Opitutaceae bacterium]
MNAAEITALRAKLCRVHIELGNALQALEDIEGLLDAEGLATLQALATPVATATTSACYGLAHSCAETACGSLEAAAAQLADLITAVDRVATALADGRNGA